jgi:hypothetical protein
MDTFQALSALSSGARLPVPTDYYASAAAATYFTVWAGGFGLLVLPWIFKKLIKDKDSIPLLMWIGGLICSLLEPMLDHLGHLWWPSNLPGPAFSGFELPVPLLIPPCYVFFISMTGYFAYYKMSQGLSVARLFTVWTCIAMTDVVMEIPGTFTQAYQYYGDTPFKILGFPLVWGWLNGTSMFLVGFLLWLVAPYLKGRNKLLVALVPVTAMGAAYGIVAWPYFLALNWPMPVYATWLWTTLSLGLCLLVVRFTAAVVGVNSSTAVSQRNSPIDSLRGNAAMGARR